MPRRTPPPAQPRARTLTEALKQRSQAELELLLTLRPDLCYPLPEDLTDLASRAGTPTSLARAVDQLTKWLRQVAEGLAALPDPTSTEELATLLSAPEAAVLAAVAELRARAMLWGLDDQIHLVRGVREHFEPYPGGLAPPSVRPLSSAQIEAALAECGEGVHALLDRLLWSPTGAVRRADRRVDAAEARSPVEQLLARQLLRPLDPDTVLLPREVSWHLRAGRFAPEPVPTEAPQVTGRSRTPALVDKAAAGAAFGLLHDVELVAQALQNTPHRLLRTGGLGARDMAALVRDLGTDLAHGAFVVECAAAAGLVANGPGGGLLPTGDYDRWVAQEAAARWRTLADGWLAGPRHYARSAQSGAHVLGPEAEAPAAPALRRLVLRLGAAAGTGTVVDPDSLATAVAWHQPRADGPGLRALVDATWAEAGWLGLLGVGAVSSFADALLAGPAALPGGVLDLFPTPVEQIIVQADLTAVAPGPLPHRLADDLRLMADQESRGGGGVYRFSVSSLRRGFEAGWSSADIRSWLEQHSSTGVPQPLAYLIDDVARQHGSIRVGSAVSYLRVEDAAQAVQLLKSPGAQALGLRSVAPGVLLATAEPDELVTFLRELGYFPAVEDDAGATLSAPPQPRAPSVRPERQPQLPAAADAVATILAVEERRRQTRPPGPSTEDTLAELATAQQRSAPVNVRWVAADGQPTERELSPLDLSAGLMRAVDARSAQVLTIPLARISSVWAAGSDPVARSSQPAVLADAGPSHLPGAPA